MANDRSAEVLNNRFHATRRMGSVRPRDTDPTFPSGGGINLRRDASPDRRAVQFQHLAGQVQAATDQHPRRAAVARNRTQRILHTRTGTGDAMGCGDDRLHRQCGMLIRLINRPDGRRPQAATAGEGTPRRSLACFMPTTRCTGRSPNRADVRPAPHRPGIVAAIQPKFPVGRQQMRQTCRAGVAVGRANRRGRGRRRRRADRGAKRGNGDAGIVVLEQPRQRGRRRVETARRRRSGTRPVSVSPPSPVRAGGPARPLLRHGRAARGAPPPVARRSRRGRRAS